MIKVTIEKLEGDVDTCGIICQDASVDVAERVLRMSAVTAPEPGQGYDKHAVDLSWGDGEGYGFRLDLQTEGSSTGAGFDLLRIAHESAAGRLNWIQAHGKEDVAGYGKVCTFLDKVVRIQALEAELRELRGSL